MVTFFIYFFRLFNGQSTEDLESEEENTKRAKLDPGKKESFKDFLSASFSKNHEKKSSKVSINLTITYVVLYFILKTKRASQISLHICEN